MSRFRGRPGTENGVSACGVRLLLDNNLSPRLTQILVEQYPGSTHVRSVDLEKASDQKVWSYAKKYGFVIASKDSDFHQMSFVLGAPPKVIWIRKGNCSTEGIAALLLAHFSDFERFEYDHEAAFLAIG